MNGSGSGGQARQQRTLLLAPPSIASHEETLRDVYTTFDRATSDLTMLDRLSSGLAALPPATYDLVVVLTDAAGARRTEAVQLLTRRVYDAVVGSMKARAVLRAQEGPPLPEAEAILAGLVAKGDGTFEKAEDEAPVLLRLGGKKKQNGVVNGHNNGNGNASIPIAKKPTIGLLPDDDLDGFGDDDELIDEDTLLTEEDINRTIQLRTSISFLLSNSRLRL
jgi:hypothetical protein